MNKQTITVPRGANVGNTIKQHLITNNMYGKVKLFVHSLTRKPEQKAIIAVISYTWF
jgi:hypothetical protein